MQGSHYHQQSRNGCTRIQWPDSHPFVDLLFPCICPLFPYPACLGHADAGLSLIDLLSSCACSSTSAPWRSSLPIQLWLRAQRCTSTLHTHNHTADNLNAPPTSIMLAQLTFDFTWLVCCLLVYLSFSSSCVRLIAHLFFTVIPTS